MGSKRRTPPDLPGMYFDAERNRYFPVKASAVAGGKSRVKSEAEQVLQDEELARIQREEAILQKGRTSSAGFAVVEKSENGNAVLSLLHKREVSGHSWKRESGTNSLAFQRQLLETYTRAMSIAEQPKIWSYDSVRCDGGIEQCRLDLQTSEGMVEVDAMLAVGFNQLQILQVCEPADDSVQGSEHATSRVNVFPNPLRHGGAERSSAPILRPVFLKLPFTSMITSVKKLNEWQEQDNIKDGRLTQNVILTTLGHGREGGFVYLMRTRQDMLNEPSRPFSRRSRVQINSDIHTAECNPRGKQV